MLTVVKMAGRAGPGVVDRLDEEQRRRRHLMRTMTEELEKV